MIRFNDLAALGLLSSPAEICRKVRSTLRIVGFDDIEDCALTYPTLSSVRCDVAGFDERIAVMILNWLGRGVRPPPLTGAPVDLVVRALSGEPE